MIRIAVQLDRQHTIGETVNKLRKTQYWVNVYKEIVFVSIDFDKDTNQSDKLKKIVEEDMLNLGLLCDYVTAMEIH